MKKTLALLLALIMAFSMFSVAAFAAGNATVNVALVDSEGNAVTTVKAGEPVWAVISVANYEEYVGEMTVVKDGDNVDVAASSYDKVISIVTTFLELDTANFTAVANSDGTVVWSSPYKANIDEKGGSMAANFDGNVLKLLLQTDCEGGLTYSISKSELDANNGELFRVKLKAKADATQGDYTVALNGGDSTSAPGIATVSSATGTAAVDVADIPVTFGAAADIAVGEGTYDGEVEDGEIIPPVDPNPGEPDPDEPDVPDEPVVDGVLVGVGFEYDAIAGDHPVAEDWIFSHANAIVHSSKGLRLKDGGDTEALDVSATYKNNFVLTNGFDLSYAYECWWNAANYEANHTYHGAKVGNISAGMVKQASGSKFNHVIMINGNVVATGTVGATVTGGGKTSYTLSYDPATKTITLTWVSGSTTDTVQYVDTAKAVDLSDAEVEFFANASWDVSEYINSAKLVGREATDIPDEPDTPVDPEEPDTPVDPEEPEEGGTLVGVGFEYDAIAGNHPVTEDWNFSHVNTKVHSSKGLRLKDGGDTEALNVSATYKNNFVLTNGFVLSYTYECFWDPNNYSANRNYHGAKVGNISVAMTKESGSSFDHVIMIDDAVVATGTVGATVAGGAKTSYTLSYDPTTKTITLTWVSGSTTDTVQYVDEANAVDVSDAEVGFFANSTWNVDEYVNSAKLKGLSPVLTGDGFEFDGNAVTGDWEFSHSQSNVTAEGTLYLTDEGSNKASDTSATYKNSFNLSNGFTLTYSSKSNSTSNYKTTYHYHGAGVGNINGSVIVVDDTQSTVQLVIRVGGTVVATSEAIAINVSKIDDYFYEYREFTLDYDVATKTITYSMVVGGETYTVTYVDSANAVALIDADVCFVSNSTWDVSATYGSGKLVGKEASETPDEPDVHVHTEVIDAAVAPDCVNTGLTEGKHCSVCGEVIVAQEVVPATGEHAWGDWIANEDGTTETRTCGTCGTTETQNIEVEECAHEWGEWKVTTPATSTAAGVKTRTCGLCGETETMEYTIETEGITGDVSWRFEDGVLYIEGAGEMADYTNVGTDVAPWMELRTEVTSVIIGDGITYVGTRAFKGMNKITTVKFGAAVLSTGYECFQGCSAITSVELNDGIVKLGSNLFYGCESLETIDIPESVSTINTRVFKNCSKLNNVVLPEALSNSSYEVFMGCTSLESINIPANYTIVAPAMFSGCTSLKEVFIPKTVLKIRVQAFMNCTALETVTFEDEDTMNGGSDAKISSNAFEGCNSTLVLKSWMAGYVNDYAYRFGFSFEATNETVFKYNVDADGNAIVIGMRGASSIITIPEVIEGHTVVEVGGFIGCNATRVNLPTTVKTISGRAFQDCVNLTTITGLDNVTKISSNAFNGCSALTDITFGSALTSISTTSFQNCTALGEIYVPNTVTSIKANSFEGCTNAIIKTQAGSAAATAANAAGVAVKIVTNFDYTVNADGESVTVTGVLGDVTNLVIPDEIDGYKVTVINSRAFQNNTTLTSIEIGNNVVEIKSNAFNGCSNVITFTAGTGLKSTSTTTFANMTSLESITFLSEDVTFKAGNFEGTNANLVVYGVAGSTAETMANTNGFTFVAL